MKKYYWLLFILLFCGIDNMRAQYTDLHNFNGTTGKYPFRSLTYAYGKFFGMTDQGGINDDGCIFSIDTNGADYKDLYDFSGAANGQNPYGNLTISSGKLYGMTPKGGVHSEGVIFSIDTNGSGFKKLLDFNGVNGAGPQGSFILSGKTLFGMVSGGGANNWGCIFSIDTNGTRYKDLFDFSFTFGNAWHPCGSLLLSGNLLYGMTPLGGTDSNGCIFSIDTNGSGYTKLHDFNGVNGGGPNGSLIISGNVLYGLTYSGGG